MRRNRLAWFPARRGTYTSPDDKTRERYSVDWDSHRLGFVGFHRWGSLAFDRKPTTNDSSATFQPLAHAGLADTYVIQALVSWADPRDLWEKARMESDKAPGLDPNLADAHTAKGIASFFMAWDWPAAERSFRRAIELNPNYAIAHQFYRLCYRIRGVTKRPFRNPKGP